MKLPRLAGIASLVLGLSSCDSHSADLGIGPDIIGETRSPRGLLAEPSRTIPADPYETLQLRISTVGSGYFVSPPEISGPAVRFVAVTLPSDQVPGGVTQVFTVEAVAVGTSVIRFRNTVTATVVEDTITVR